MPTVIHDYLNKQMTQSLITEIKTRLATKADALTTYTKAEVDALLDTAVEGSFLPVDVLPTTGIQRNKIYLVPKIVGSTTAQGYSTELGIFVPKNSEDLSEGYKHYTTIGLPLADVDKVTDQIDKTGYTTDDAIYVKVSDEQYDKYTLDGTFEESITDADAITALEETLDGVTASTVTVEEELDDPTATLTLEEVTIKTLSSETNNTKDEYVNLTGNIDGWEKIGDTIIDLSGYVQTAQMVPITAEELAEMWNN